MYVSDRTREYFATRPATDAELTVYRYVRQLSKKEPSTAIQDFYRLMFQGNTYPNPEAKAALADIVAQPDAAQQVLYVINRCLYTIGNPWRIDPAYHPHLRTLILKLEEIPSQTPKDPITRKWVTYLRQYVATDTLYRTLRRQLYLLPDSPMPEGTLADHFKDYFFIQETSTMTPDMPPDYRRRIRQQQRQQGIVLNQQLEDYRQAYQTTGKATNPTRIPDQQLIQLIRAVHPDQPNSYQVKAKRLGLTLADAQTMGDFRTQFHHYLMEPLTQVESHPAQGRVSRILHNILDSVGPADASYGETLEVRTCTQLLKQLVCNTVDNPKSSQFRHFIDRVGHQLATTVLLKIVLFRRTVQPWFEDRFGILFHTWEQARTETIPWVVQAFEYMNVALALNLNRVCYV